MPMPSTDNSGETPPTTSSPASSAAIIISTALDTTWRMFVPTIGGTLLGLWLDSMWNTKPVLLIIGIVLGVTLSAVLVLRQLKAVRKS